MFHIFLSRNYGCRQKKHYILYINNFISFHIAVHVKIGMIVSGKTVRERKTTKKDIIEPVFNESFHFDLHDDGSLEHTTLDVTVIINKGIIGQTFVGPSMYVTGTGLEHWKSMINSPRNAVAMWHTLS